MNLPKTIYKRAEKEAINSQLPGRQDGPADAYRHILAAAEAVRQGYPKWLVRSWGSVREWNNPPGRAAMDRHNNDVGINIGLEATTWNDILNKARNAIENGSKSLNNNSANWRPKSEWGGNPKNDTTSDPNDRWSTDQTNWPPRWHDGDSPNDPKWWHGEDSEKDENTHNFVDFLGGFSDWFGKKAQDWMEAAGDWFDAHPDFFDAEHAISPIVIDLDGDGVQTLAPASGRHFDLDNSGFAEQTAWVDSGDGLLVRDLDGNGRIESGAELFGDHTARADGSSAADGYAALAQYDDNGDGLIDAKAPIWQQLNIWQDSDSDAQSTAEELHALAAGDRISDRSTVRRDEGFYHVAALLTK